MYQKIDGKKLIWGKKYSTIAEWEPLLGFEFFKFIPDHPIFASNILLLQSVVEVHNTFRHNRDKNYSDFL